MGCKVGVSVQFKKTDETSDDLDELLYKFKRYIQTKSSARPYIDWYLDFEYHQHGDVIEYYYKNFKPADWLKENEFEFIKATNGYELKPSREMYELFKGNDFAYRKGIIGCAYSHYKLWKQLLEDDEHDFYVIMEDDITVKKEFKKKLMELKKDLSEKDTVFMGYHMSGTNQKKHKDIYFDNQKSMVLKELNNNIYVGGYYCYSINKIGAKKMMNYIQKNNKNYQNHSM